MKIHNQITFLLKQPESKITFILIMLFVLTNYIGNVIAFSGLDIAESYRFIKLITNSFSNTNDSADILILFNSIYPLLVTLPAGLSIIKEQQSHENVYIISRIGKNKYYLNHIISCFITTSIIFFIPFFIEIIYTVLSFPLDSSLDPMEVLLYTTEYNDLISKHLFYNFYSNHPILYAIAAELWFALYSGLMGTLSLIFSMIFKYKYRAQVFIPVFLFLHITTIMDYVLDGQGTYIWYEYVYPFTECDKNYYYAFTILILTIIFIITSFLIVRKKDILS